MRNSLKKLEWLVKGYFVKYALGLILGKEKRWCTKMAEHFGVSHDSIYKYLSDHADLSAQFPGLMIELALHFDAKKKGWIVIDDTALTKLYSKYIEGVSWIYNSSLGRPEMGLCIVVAIWTDGEIVIPIGFEWWFSKKIMPNGYQKKIELAQKLLSRIAETTHFRQLLADAAYISIPMIKFLEHLNFEFVTRISCARKVTSSDGVCAQMKDHPALKLDRNRRSKVVRVKLQDLDVNIVVFKRKKKRSCECENIFLVTNISASAQTIIALYDIRWVIEETFRTMKQSLGLMQCAARSIEKQSLHVSTVFFSFAFLESEKKQQNFACRQDAIRYLQALKLKHAFLSFDRFCHDFFNVA